MNLSSKKMSRRHWFGLSLTILAFAFLSDSARAEDFNKATGPIAKGQRVYSIGHSFHVFMPGILNELAKAAEIKDHTQVGLSSIGGSRVIQHWDVVDDKFKSKEMLKGGKVDVLTMAPIFLPDDGIENFVKLAFENNPNIRITVQEFWLPHDQYNPSDFRKPSNEDRNSVAIEVVKARHHAYFETIDAHVKKLNEQLGKPVVYVAPVGQAVVALREKIVAGQAPGLTKQNDLFTDPIGHATAPLQALVAYTHFAVTYRRSPVGLPAPSVLTRSKTPVDPALVKVLQELAWQAAIEHPLSGVKVDAQK